MMKLELARFNASNIIIRLDKKTGELCLYTVEQRVINKQDYRVATMEINVKDPNNVIRWEGRPKPGGRGFARNYLNKEDYERYGLIYPKTDTIMSVDSSFSYDKEYTTEELKSLIDRINEKRKKKDEVEVEDGGQR